MASPPRPRQPSTPSELPRSSTTPKTALQGSVRSRDPKSKKPAARPLAKRAYAYVDRLRGASKYLDADDNARLVEEASIDGFFRPRGGRCGLAWCESTDEISSRVVLSRRPICSVRTTPSPGPRLRTPSPLCARTRRSPPAGASSKRSLCTIRRRDPKSGDSIGFTKKLVRYASL